MPAPEALARYRGDVDSYLRSFLGDREPPELYQMARYHLGWEDASGKATQQGGKGLRPTLTLVACEAVGKEWRNALPAAAAIELVHNFSLIHDDIQDRDAERHHRPTVWSVWGEAQAINAGDALLALARLAVLRLIEGDVPPRTVMSAAQMLDERTLEMVEGQVMDIGFEGRLDVSVDEYMPMIEKKSAALFDASLTMGTMAGGAPDETVAAMGRFGRLLGTGFQVADDIHGVWASEAETGKQPASDVRRRKKALPAVYVLSQAQGEALARLRAVYGKAELEEADVAWVLRLMDEMQAREYCLERLAECRANALSSLAAIELRPGPATDLREIAEYLLGA